MHLQYPVWKLQEATEKGPKRCKIGPEKEARAPKQKPGPLFVVAMAEVCLSGLPFVLIRCLCCIESSPNAVAFSIPESHKTSDIARKSYRRPSLLKAILGYAW